MIYLDANATEPMRPHARVATSQAMEVLGNPSSVHGAGREARQLLEASRETIAARFGVPPADVVLTSGGTEANALAIAGLQRDRRVIVSAVEHPAILSAAPQAAILPVDGRGVVDLGVLDALLRDGPQALVCVMAANNETGVIQPIAEVAALCRQHGAVLHVDAVQAAGRVAIDFVSLGVQSMAISSHKLGGPTGAGALILSPELTDLPALIAGGGQERGRRGGTPALPCVAGFAAAAAYVPSVDSTTRLAGLRDCAEAAAVALGAVVCGAGADRLPNTTCLALPGVRADAQVIALDLAGVAVSAGAACSSGKVATSHVLQAMGMGKLAAEAIRVSLPWNTTDADITGFVAAYQSMANGFRPAVARHS